MRNTIILLRFPFSLFLLPVYLFALSQSQNIIYSEAWAVFFILHFLVYPASNGYNSYMDNDKGPIGGLQKPPEPTKKLFYVSLGMDLLAISLSAWLSILFSICILTYILASRAYSYRHIRLKKYPYIGFITVALFQGAFLFIAVITVLSHISFTEVFFNNTGYAAIASSLLLGAIYPLTQIYQHESDVANGDITISYKLGYTGTFLFSAALFSAANFFLYVYFSKTGHLQKFWLLQLMTIPIIFYFSWWCWKVFKNVLAANFTNTMRMNAISSFCLNTYFFILVLINQ